MQSPNPNAPPVLPMTRKRFLGICEVSGGVFLDAGRIAVASDESNVLRIYNLANPALESSVSLVAALGYDKSDLEDGAVGDGVVYWTASQAMNSKGKDTKRKVVFAMPIVTLNGKATLAPPTIVRQDFKPDLMRLSGSTPENINVEGMTTTPDGGLMFGFRNLVDRRAALVTLKNAAQVLSDPAAAPDFTATARLDLGGRGIRSLERVGTRYLISAGKPNDATEIGFALFWWDGDPGQAPQLWTNQPDFNDFDPEVLLATPDRTGVLILSDDGNRCPKVDLEDPPSNQRGFQTMQVPWP